MNQPSILFFGATGGTVNACLTQSLKSGTYRATALVRTPERLTTQLQEQQKLTEHEISNLEIIAGDALDLAVVKSAIEASQPDIIISGLGMVPKLELKKLAHPSSLLDPAGLCSRAAEILVTAMNEVQMQKGVKKPHLAFVSTTGITRGPEDVPFGMRYLYHSILGKPHADKRAMEDEFRGKEAEKCFATVTGIRPTLLTGAGVLGEGVGPEKVRAGTEAKPETGFTIARADVGTFIWEHVAQDVKRSDGRSWRGEMISLAC